MLGAVQADKDIYEREKAVELILPENICVNCAEDKAVNTKYYYKKEKKEKYDKRINR